MSSLAKTDYNAYFKEFKILKALWCLFLIAVFVLFSTPLKNIYGAVLIIPLLHFCPENDLIVDFIFLLYTSIAIYFTYKQFQKRLLPTINSLVFSVCILIIYFAFFRYSPDYRFYFFKICILRPISYADVFIIATLIFVSSYKPYLKPLVMQASKYSLLEDGPSIDAYSDIYSRGKYAAEIAGHVSKTSTDNSFAVGVIGEWGSGKTDFLLRLKKVLKTDTNNIVFEFNPWRVSKPEAIVDDFFNTLSNELKDYNQSITAKIRDYSKKILQTGKELQYRVLDTLLGEWIENESVQKQYTTINTSIRAIAKRVIVIIDDVDRLTGKEVMEVLRIIRNTANFSNTFFIVGIDQRYIVNVLKNTREFTDEEEYLKKVFQLTITLPAFKKDVFIDQARDFLITDDLNEEEKNVLNGVLSKLAFDLNDLAAKVYPALDNANLFEKLIDNVRDLKRFCNSFKIAYQILKGEVDIYDLMVLELIRNRNIELYNLIRSRKLLDFDAEHSEKFILKEDRWREFENTHKDVFSVDELKNLKEAVKYLVTDENYKNSRKFEIVYNFYLYFSYQLFDLISFNEYNELLLKDADTIISKFNEWSDEGKQSELLRITGQMTDFPDADFLLKILIVYSNIKLLPDAWYPHVYKLVFHFRAYNHERYFGKDIQKHKEFLCKLMSTDKISLFKRANLAHEFLLGHIQKSPNESSFILTKKEWQKVIYSLFDKYLKGIQTLTSGSLSFFYLNDDKRVDGDKIRLYLPACKILKDTLYKNDQLFSDYVKMLIRPAFYGSINDLDISSFVLEPFLEQIFGSWQLFKQHLTELNLTEPEFVRSKQIILSVIDRFYNSNKQPFHLSDKQEKQFVKELIAKQQNR